MQEAFHIIFEKVLFSFFLFYEYLVVLSTSRALSLLQNYLCKLEDTYFIYSHRTFLRSFLKWIFILSKYTNADVHHPFYIIRYFSYVYLHIFDIFFPFIFMHKMIENDECKFCGAVDQEIQ